MRHAYRAKLRLTTVAIFLAAARAFLLLKRTARDRSTQVPGKIQGGKSADGYKKKRLPSIIDYLFMACTRPSDASARQSGRTRKRGGEIAIGLSSMTVK